MNFYFGMGGTPISLRQKLRMQRKRMQCASLWPVVLNVLNSYFYRKCRPGEVLRPLPDRHFPVLLYVEAAASDKLS